MLTKIKNALELVVIVTLVLIASMLLDLQDWKDKKHAQQIKRIQSKR